MKFIDKFDLYTIHLAAQTLSEEALKASWLPYSGEQIDAVLTANDKLERSIQKLVQQVYYRRRQLSV